jgi:hypothetical protein
MGLRASVSEQGIYVLHIALEKVSSEWQSVETPSVFAWGKKTTQSCWLGGGPMKIPLTPFWIVVFDVTLACG